MPSYDYYCKSNGRTVEVEHRMSETLTTWGDLCQRAGIEPGGTDASAPVERMMSRAMASTSSKGEGEAMGGGHVHSGGCGCGNPMGGCGMGGGFSNN